MSSRDTYWGELLNASKPLAPRTKSTSGLSVPSTVKESIEKGPTPVEVRLTSSIKIPESKAVSDKSTTPKPNS